MAKLKAPCTWRDDFSYAVDGTFYDAVNLPETKQLHLLDIWGRFMGYPQIAKITRPDFQTSIKRERVYSLLDRACSKPTVWVSAPPGSGKTTLVADFSEARRSNCLWYQADTGDKDLTSFYHYLRMSAEMNSPGSGNSLPQLNRDKDDDTSFARRFFEALFLRLGNEGEMPACLVIDNYQSIPENAMLHRILADSLDSVPKGINVIIISRYQPPPQYAKLRANSKLAVMNPNDILFTFSETTEFLSSMKVHGNTTASLLHNATKGWAAGLVLLTEQYKACDTDYDDVISMHQDIFNYFAEETGTRFDAIELDFLTKTAFLPEMTHYTAEAISGSKDAERILFNLCNENHFTEKKHTGSITYQYHPLFKKFLRTRAKKTLDADQLQELPRKAALLLTEIGKTDDAVALYLSVGDYARAACLVIEKSPSMVKKGRGKNLRAWIDRLPEHLCIEMPWLYYWKGVCYSSFTPDMAINYFQEAFHCFHTENNNDGILLAWTGIIDAIVTKQNDMAQLDSWTQWLDEYMEKQLPFPSGDVESKVVTSMIGAMRFQSADDSFAGKWLQRAGKLVEDDSISDKADLFFNLIMYYLHTGNNFDAGLLLKKLDPFINASSSSLVFRIKWYLAGAMYADMVQGSGEEAVQLAEKGLALSQHAGIHLLDLSLLTQCAYGSLTMYDLEKAEYYLELIGASLEDRDLRNISIYHFIRGWKALCEGNPRKSTEHITLTLNMFLKTGCTFSRSIAHIGLSHAFLEINDIETAEKHIATAKTITPKETDSFKFLYHLTQALVFFRKDEERKGSEALARALALGRKRGYFNTPFWKHENMGMLCTWALENNLETAYVQELIRKRNLHPLPAIQEYEDVWVENWPYPLRITTLDKFKIEVHGSELNLSGRVQKPLDMLKVLIALGCKNVPVQNITDVLYPEADGDRANYSFKFTLHHLRKLLGSARFLLMHGGKLSLNTRYCYNDVDAFLHLAARIKKKAGKQDGGDIIVQLAGKAAALYKTDFLAQDDLGCIVAAREKIRKKFLELVANSGQYFESAGRNQKAIDLYEKAIETDELQERFYRRLMLCHVNAGEISEALLVYRRCHNILGARLGIEPSHETKAIYKSITVHGNPPAV